MKSTLLIFGFVAFAIPSAARATLVAAGPELIIGASSGDLVDSCAYGDGYAVLTHDEAPGPPQLHRFDREGNALDAPITVPGADAIACDDEGGFVVAWTRLSGLHSSRKYVQRFDAFGDATTGEIEVAVSDGFEIAVSLADDGSFVVGWGANDRIFVQRFDGSGVPQGSVIETGLFTPTDGVPHFIEDSGGGALVIISTDGDSAVVDATGAIVRRDEVFAFPMRMFDACVMPGGDIVVVGGESFSPGDVIARLYSPDDGTVGPMFVVNSYTSGRQQNSSIACLGDGSFVVSWDSYDVTDDSVPITIEGDVTGLYWRRFTAPGVPADLDSPLNVFRVGAQWGSHTQASGTRVFSAWRSNDRTLHRVFCDDGDPDCRYACPGSDPEHDPDADGTSSGCDLCENVSGAQNFVGRAVLTARSQSHNNPRFSKLVVKGEVALPPSMPGGLSDFDPQTQSVRIVVESEAGYVADVTIPPSATWQRNAAGTKWTYKYQGVDAPGGIYKATLVDRSGQLPRAVRFSFIGRGRVGEDGVDRVVYPVSYLDRALNAAVVFGDSTAAATGRCGEVQFAPESCKTSLKTLRTISCK